MEKLLDKPYRPEEISMTGKKLFPFDGITNYASINLYQRKTGTLLYVAVITRPDIAYDCSKLTRFNLNSGSEHHTAVDRVINYLLSTRYYALSLGRGDTFATYTDSSFADDPFTRWSSQAYVIVLFGGVVGWRANKQDTVTTSTTAAELLALS
jgi:hypothetical protein